MHNLLKQAYAPKSKGEKEIEEESESSTKSQHELQSTSESEYTSTEDEMHQDGSEADIEEDSGQSPTPSFAPISVWGGSCDPSCPTRWLFVLVICCPGIFSCPDVDL